MVRYRRITIEDPLYPGECRLRERVLLTPIGYDIARFCREYPGVDEHSEHFIATTKTPGGDRVIGCALLLAESDRQGFGRLTQMAVDPQRRGEGIGQRIVINTESRAFGELGLDGIYCNAQIHAVSFYEKLGWSREGEKFIEADIPHQRMVIHRPPELQDEASAPVW